MSKVTKQRHCPATGRTITSAECGTNRHSRYACPAECPHNPFAPSHYTALLETEARLDAALFNRLLAEDDSARLALAEAVRSNPGHGHHAAAVCRLFYQPDREGHTLAARWEAAGSPGLKNDERVMLRGKMQTRVALLEVRQVLDEQSVNAIDLLDPARPIRRYIDRQIASRAVRFSVVLTWAYPLPHFWRVSGTGVVLPEFASLEPEEVVGDCIAHLGGPTAPGEARARWLLENFTRVDGTLTAASLARRQQMFAGLDAQFGAATYELCVPFREGRAALAADPAVGEDDLSPEESAEGLTEAMVWFDDLPVGRKFLPAAARQVKGRVLLGRKQWRVEAFGAVRFAELRARFEATLGSRVRFTTERRDDLGARMVAKEPPVDLTAVPPRLLEQPMQLDLQSSRLPGPPSGVSLEAYQVQMAEQMRRTLLDAPIPALDGLTPRTAARNPAFRARLLRLMKGHVRQLDEENLRSGRSDDINEYLRELGLFEIDVPPPPPRAVPLPDVRDDDEFDDDEFDGDYLSPEAGRPAAPRLMGAPLTLNQALDGLEKVMNSLDSARSGLDELDRSGATVIQDVAEFSQPWMSEDEFNYLATFLIQAWFVLVPRGVRAPELRLGAMETAISAAEKRLLTTGRSGVLGLEKFIGDCRQPGLLQALAGGLVDSVEKVPKKMQPSPSAIIGMTILLKVVLDELDHSLRA